MVPESEKAEKEVDLVKEGDYIGIEERELLDFLQKNAESSILEHL